MKITFTNLYRVGKKFLAALTNYTSLPLTHFSKSTVTAALATAKAKRTAHVAAVQATRLATSKVKQVRLSAIAFATICRDALAPALGGRKWNSSWIPAGWKTSGAIPQSLNKLVQLLEDLHQFLVDHPEMEVDKHNVTAAHVQDYLDRIEAATNELSTAKTTQRQARTERKKAETELMKQARGVVGELELILSEDDERWIEFTGEVPGDEQRPEPVETVVLSSDTPGEAEADWERPARAERFQVCIFIVGVDTKYRHIMTVKDTNARLTNLPPGAEVKVQIIAANAAGEAAPSDEVTASVAALSEAA
jgi:hypothetical protein